MQRIAIVGAGLIGRLLALSLSNNGEQITLIDQGDRSASSSAAFAAAGLLAPWNELQHCTTLVSALGELSLRLWPQILAQLAMQNILRADGTITLAHAQDREELSRLKAIIDSKSDSETTCHWLVGENVRSLEPELENRFSVGLYFPDEGSIDARRLLLALRQKLEEKRINWIDNVTINVVSGNCVAIQEQRQSYDWVFDCRGLGAKTDIPDLRGVRGELLLVHAPDVHLRRVIRLMHPRYPLYIVPRGNHEYVIGATSIESESNRPITLRSMLELLTAAYAIHPGFAEASLIETATACRPAFPHDQPRIDISKGLIRINGLYRHGFLLAPLLVQQMTHFISMGTYDDSIAPIVRKVDANSCEW